MKTSKNLRQMLMKKSNRFTLDIFYNLGLNNIAEDGDNDFIETNIKNRSLNMNLIYWIK